MSNHRATDITDFPVVAEFDISPYQVIIDLDNTIFRTYDFLRAVIDKLCHQGLMDSDDKAKAVELFIARKRPLDKEETDDMGEVGFFESRGISLDKLYEIVLSFENKQRYLFDDVLRFFGSPSNKSLVLTKGEYHWQNLKINFLLATLKQLPVEFMIISKDKSTIVNTCIAKSGSDKSLVMVDDRADNLNDVDTSVQKYLIKRYTSTKYDSEVVKQHIVRISSLDQINLFT